jgi:phage recombination protein Bet
MSNIVALRQPSGALTRQDGRRIELFRKTVGKELQGTEIDEALEWCEIYGANPFVRDIYFFVFDAKDADKRRVVPVLGIGLYRKIAARSGNYRPDEAAPRFHYDEAAKSPVNPTGVVWCEVTVYRHSHGAWHPVTSRLKWEERAPIREVWSFDKDEGKRKPSGSFELDPKKSNWRTMGETMMAKCCEADAIRKGWPNETSGSYIAEELDASKTIDATAVEIADAYATETRLKRIGADNSIVVQWEVNGPIVPVPVGQFGDKAIAWIKDHEKEPMTVKLWHDRNVHSIREYWARDTAGALELKRVIELATAGAAE